MTPAELRALAKWARELQDVRKLREVFIALHKAEAITDGPYDRAMALCNAGAFLDAAASLMPAGWWAVIKTGPSVCYVDVKRAGDWRRAWGDQTSSPTEPQARVAAALLARAADMEASDADR
jgi:hypothetical protein